jgi:quercetin dioxygenase-like cupin family protein
MNHSLSGWDIGRGPAREWAPWGGATGKARAKVLAIADDYLLTLVEAQPGYASNAHEHTHPEFLYVISGQVRTQGIELQAGDSYAAATGSVHTDFATDTGATYVLTFRL